MRIGAIVQARMGSARLPGKVLMDLAGRPALEYLLERLQHAATLVEIIVATSDQDPDDAVEEYCGRAGVRCHRGPHDDVAGRMLEAAERFELDAFVRVNGDSPLIDQGLVDVGVTRFGECRCDLVSNVFPRSFPRGQSVEVLSSSSLRAALARMTEPGDREHVTAVFYRDAGHFAIENFDAGEDGVGPDGGAVRLVLDTPADAAAIERILRAMERPHWQYSWKDVLDLATAGVGKG